MAYYRTISLSFWSDSKITDDFTPEDKYFMLYLLTNTHTNLIGCYEITFNQMARETGYNKETVERLINRMEKVHHILMYDLKTKEVFIRNWSKYNWTDSKKLQKGVIKVFNSIKSDYLKEEVFEVMIKHGFEKEEIGYTYPMYTSVTVPVTDTVTVTDKDRASKSTIFGEFGNVKLSQEEFDKLMEKLGTLKTCEFIERLSSYIAQSGKKYKSHYATILNWYRREEKESKKGDGNGKDKHSNEAF